LGVLVLYVGRLPLLAAQHGATSSEWSWTLNVAESQLFFFASQAAVTQHDHVMSVLNRQMRQNAPLLLQIIFFMGWCALFFDSNMRRLCSARPRK